MNSIALCFVNSLDDILNQFCVPQASKSYVGEVVDALKEEIEARHEPDQYHGDSPACTDSFRKQRYFHHDDGTTTVGVGSEWTPSYVQSWLSRRLLTTVLGLWTTNLMLTKGLGFIRVNGRCEYLAIGMFMEMWIVMLIYFLVELWTMTQTREGATKKWTLRQVGRTITMTFVLIAFSVVCISVSVFAPYVAAVPSFSLSVCLSHS